jgi:glycerol-3-phosphate acyltransferase PlsY
MALKLVIIAILAYALGCVSSGILISRYIFNTDIRSLGNPTYSKIRGLYKAKGLVYVLIADLFKAIIVILIGGLMLKSAGFPATGKLTAMFFALLGQIMPITNGFRPRKGISWGGWLLLIADWRIFLVCGAAYLILVGISKYPSLGALAASIAFPVFVGIFYGGWLRVLIAAGCSLIIIIMYRKNLLRLLLSQNSGKRNGSSVQTESGEKADELKNP